MIRSACLCREEAKHVVIVGAGPVGLLAAIFLANLGFNVDVRSHFGTQTCKLSLYWLLTRCVCSLSRCTRKGRTPGSWTLRLTLHAVFFMACLGEARAHS